MIARRNLAGRTFVAWGLIANLVFGQAAPSEKHKVEITVESVVRPATDTNEPLMQVALLLDTSNSMDGLINQARSQLWAIVNELAAKKKEGCVPRLEVALFEYGNNRLPATENYIRQVVPLTADLDRLSEALFSLTTNGGSEYCGAVIDEAMTELNWSPGHGHYKAIFIAGNEPFTQGEVDYAQACARARAEGTIVNTIHCGNEQAGIHGKWKHGAALGGGKFITIDQDRAIAHIHCPQDEILLKLNIELNTTYIPYGKMGSEGAMRQRTQDSNAAMAAPQSAIGRVVSKSRKGLYNNVDWDLVDAVEANEEVLVELDSNTLPPELRDKSPAELKVFIATQQKKRANIQKEIAQVAAERDAYLKEKRLSDAADDSLGAALKDVLNEQAVSKGYE